MEFQIGIESAAGIKKTLYECRLEMMEDSTTQLNGTPSPKTERLPYDY